MTAASDPWIGKTLGRYRIVRRIGRGGMGSVYEAVQQDLGRRVALKVLHGHLTEDADLVARFRREAETAAGLSHPNIVQVTDFGSVPGETVYLVMELLEGESLAGAIAREGRLAPDRVAFIAAQILSALGAAHHAGIVHRDLKPDNVLLGAIAGVRDIAKVVDFGIAKLSGSGKLTATGTVVGTPAYMAPEQARGADVDARADLYSVGALMYEALTGRPPFEAPSYHALMVKVLEAQPVPVRTVAPEIDPALAAVVERAMAKEPAARFSSADAMAAALAPWADPAFDPTRDRGTAPTAPALVTPTDLRPPAHAPPPTAPATATAPSSERRGVPAWTLALAAGLLLGGGVLYAIESLDDGTSEPTAAFPSSAALEPMPGPSTVPHPMPVAPIALSPAGAQQIVSGLPAVAQNAPAPTPAPEATTGGGGGAIGDNSGGTPEGDRGAEARARGRRATHGSVADYTGCACAPYPTQHVRDAYDRARDAVSRCFAAHRFSTIDHQYTDWRIAIDPAGTVTGVTPGNDHARAIPALGPCVAAALRSRLDLGPPPTGEAVSIRISLRNDADRDLEWERIQ